jgi:hypothetical protein
MITFRFIVGKPHPLHTKPVDVGGPFLSPVFNSRGRLQLAFITEDWFGNGNRIQLESLNQKNSLSETSQKVSLPLTSTEASRRKRLYAWVV